MSRKTVPLSTSPLPPNPLGHPARASLITLCRGLPLHPLPDTRSRDPNIPHAPVRSHNLDHAKKKLALKNALRYFPEELHKTLAPEFANELSSYGHIYMYRFVPDIEMKAYPVWEYPCRCLHAACIMHMIMNNMDPEVAQYPQELVTYGGNGQVFSNWAQFWIVMHYLALMSEEQTLVLYSGHPLGLFPSLLSAPRVIITNGMVIPNFSSRSQYDDMFALGVTMYGQMTAGSYCYIGPQGIVHGTTVTLLNAGRKYLGTDRLEGKVFLSSGLGGMSGAQAKASVICGCIGVIAEVDRRALMKRYEQGWLEEYTDDLDDLILRIKRVKEEKRSTSIGFLGNVVSVWEKMVEEQKRTGERLVDMGSDQTSCHNPYNGGYYPVDLTFEDANQMMSIDPDQFRARVRESLLRHMRAIDYMCRKGTFFWDYGNAFLLEAGRAGADVYPPGTPSDAQGIRFKYPSYVQDIMGDIFSLGFGPFRWVCTSGDPADLERTDFIADCVMQDILQEGLNEKVHQQYQDNRRWIEEASRNNLVVGSQARILYSDQVGRVRIAKAFNRAIHNGEIKYPVVISRDHHDVSGTDSPFRETSNIEDGSAYTADMSVQNSLGLAARGATWVALHNGGGVGWGEVSNGGFGLVLDGSDDAHRRTDRLLNWDVANGIARRSWSGHPLAEEAVTQAMGHDVKLQVTMPHHADDELLERTIRSFK